MWSAPFTLMMKNWLDGAIAGSVTTAGTPSKDQSNPKVEGLLKYCAKHGHWSVFEQATMTVEVVTPLAIAVQLLRHRSFTFQQFSGRYEDQQEMVKHTADLTSYNNLFYMPEVAREQDPKNRQNSIPASNPALTDAMWTTMSTAYIVALQCYNDLLTRGVAKEIARFVLPQGVFSRLYVTGNCRSFLHYIGVRDDEGVAQYEHCELARSIKSVFTNTFPTVSKAVFDVVPAPLEKENEELRAEIEVLKAIQRGKL
jgi:thymidylate synthase (FAD)